METAKTTYSTENTEPITETPVSHAVGTGVGGIAGAVATGAVVGTFAGPVGAALGALVGGLAGGLLGLGLSEHVNLSGQEDKNVKSPQSTPPIASATPTIAVATKTLAAVEPIPMVKRAVTHEMIQVAAYYIFLKGSGGSQEDDWFRAERELNSR